MTVGPRTHTYEVNAMLRVSKECERLIAAFFVEYVGVRPGRVKSDLHLTVYHGRRPLPGLGERTLPVDVVIDTAETRFMVLAPGGENPRPALDPNSQSVGIRVTRRNRAIVDIQRLREGVYRFESPAIVGRREATTAWTNCFGSRHYQPHIQLLRPWSKIGDDLHEIGRLFRSQIRQIDFDVYQIEFRIRSSGEWVRRSSGRQQTGRRR